MSPTALPSKRQLRVLATVGVAVVAYFCLMGSRVSDVADASGQLTAVMDRAAAKQELNMLQTCLDKSDARQRDCLVDAAPQLHDWLTTRRAAKALVPWLQSHPSDSEAQTAASGLVDRAWDSWHADYQKVTAQEDAAARRILDAPWNIFSWGRPPMRSLVQVSVKATEALDISVNAPAEAARFAARRAAYPADATH